MQADRLRLYKVFMFKGVCLLLFLMFQMLSFPNKVTSLSDSLCIRGVYGRNANRIITLANGLEEAQNAI